MIGKLLQESGGLAYHFKALKYFNSLWKPYIQEIKIWQNNLKPKNKNLVLIGPSSGYTLSEVFLKKYKKIYILEIDPLAVFLLSKKLNSQNIDLNFEKKIFFNQKLQKDYKLQNYFHELNQYFTKHDFMFCNFLGQLPFILNTYSSDDYIEFYKNDFYRIFKNTNLFSYHDKYSIHSKKNINKVININNFSKNKSIKSYSKLLSLENQSTKLKITDHLIDINPASLFRSTYIPWKISPKSLHIIETITYSSNVSSS